MEKWQVIRKFLWLVPLLNMIILCINSNIFLISILCLISIGIVFYVYIRYELIRVKHHFANKIYALEQKQLDMLSIQRHDAMNDVQILLGYIRLDKKDKCTEYVDKIKERAQRESVVAKLNDYQLISYMNELKSHNFDVDFEIEILNDTKNWKKECSLFLIEIIACYVQHKTDNEKLSICIAIDDDIHIQFEYNGELSDGWKADVESKAAHLLKEERLILTIDEHDINSTFLA